MGNEGGIGVDGYQQIGAGLPSQNSQFPRGEMSVHFILIGMTAFCDKSPAAPEEIPQFLEKTRVSGITKSPPGTLQSDGEAFGCVAGGPGPNQDPRLRVFPIPPRRKLVNLQGEPRVTDEGSMGILQGPQVPGKARRAQEGEGFGPGLGETILQRKKEGSEIRYMVGMEMGQ